MAVVRGRSMEPTLQAGDRLLVRYVGAATAPDLRPGSLVICRLPGGRPVAVKRLRTWRDGRAWVERDNPGEGVDSWQVGALPARDVIAVVLARLWPRPSLLRAEPAAPGDRPAAP